MNNWSVSELLESTAYGTLYVIEKKSHILHCSRLRKNKKGLYLTNERAKFTTPKGSERVTVGNLIFIEKGTKRSHFLQAEGDLNRRIMEALK